MLSAADLRQAIEVSPEREKDLAGLAASVVDLFESKTNRLWAYRTDYEVDIGLDSAADRFFWLPLYPIETLELKEKDNTADWNDAVVIVSSDFARNGRGRIERLRIEPWLGRFVRAKITGGYTRETCPPAIKSALIAQAAFQMTRLSPQQVALASQGFAGGSTSYLAPDMHPLFKSAVDDNTRHV